MNKSIYKIKDKIKPILKRVVFSSMLFAFIAIFISFNFSKPIAHSQTAQSFICKDGRSVTDYNLCLSTSAPVNTNSNMGVGADNGRGAGTYTQMPQQINMNMDNILSSGAFNSLDPTDYPYCVYLTSDLSYGKKSNDVSALQLYLTDRGFLETGATGYFGRATEMAVKKFQYKNEIDTTGVAGPMTRETLRGLTCEPVEKVVVTNKPISPYGRKYYDQDLTTMPAQQANVSTSNTNTNTNPKTTVNTSTKSSSGASNTSSNYTSVKLPPTNAASSSPTVKTPPASQSQQIISAPNFNFSSGSSIQAGSKLSVTSGTFSVTSKNNLYFTYKTSSNAPGICLTLSSTDCTVSANFQPLTDGASTQIFDATNMSGQWLLTLHYNSTWGASGSTVKIYFKDTPADTPSIYTVRVQ